ncbi:MAG: lipid A biosynthesis acyltransferase, partial [Candidatus Competibacteraceae bacterium]|nr:lipid A biosynthesis acyltransferase [Candidatus Competibacteraceae bacterium]
MIRRAGLTGLLRLTAALPLPLAHRIGSMLGWLLWRFPNGLRWIAAEILAFVSSTPDPVEAKLGHLARISWNSKLFLELGPLWLWPGARVLDLVRAPVVGEEALSAAVRQQRGAILITPHLGAWEMAGLYYSSRYPLTILYRPSRLGLDELSCRGRGRLGGKVVATDSSGIRTLVAALRKGEALGILPDQDPGDEGGVFAPFFGIAASTMTLVSRLALKTGAPVFWTGPSNTVYEGQT